jgi:single-stranded-DNA-specific exonuclease
MTNVIWERPKDSIQRNEEIQALLSSRKLRHLHPSVTEVLYNRGFTKEEEIVSFFDNDPSKVHNPLLMMDMEKGIMLVKEALEKNKHLVIYGDYDADGASATAIGVLGLRKLGAHVDYFINNRFDHGYGIKPEGVDDLLKAFPTVDMIITVDNGIVAYEGIDYANEKGIDVIVTDHHDPHPSGKMPNALAIINPKRPGDEYPFKGICGATVIHKFMLALYWEMDEALDYVDDMMDIVGMATIGDMMPLLDENRIFVKQSLKLVKQGTRPAFAKLVEKTEISLINEEMFGFKFVPMVNAPSRLLGSIELAVDLFLTEDEKEMGNLIDKLIALNDERKEITAVQEALAMKMIEDMGDQPFYVLYNPEFDEGIVGLVAGRIKEAFHRPAIVLTNHHGIAKGSGRSIEAFHITDALHATTETLIGFGGHAGACGMSLDVTKIDELRERLCEMAQNQLTEEDMTPKIFVDAYVEPVDLTVEYVDELDTLRPFGQGFEKPFLQLTNFNSKDFLLMGENKNHLKVMGTGKVDILMFSYADHFREIGAPQKIIAVGYPGLNVWKNKISVQFQVKDNNLRPA